MSWFQECTFSLSFSGPKRSNGIQVKLDERDNGDEGDERDERDEGYKVKCKCWFKEEKMLSSFNFYNFEGG